MVCSNEREVDVTFYRPSSSIVVVDITAIDEEGTVIGTRPDFAALNGSD